MRTLAIDLGEKRVGLAMSDEGGRFATPLEVLTVSSAEGALEPVRALIVKEGVQRVVVGLPLNMDGTLGPQARRATAWGKRLGEGLAAKIVFVDERLSSFAAEQQLNARRRSGEKLTRGRKKAQRDALAAAIFLQAYLDGELGEVGDG